ncbi:hypothetical protein [Marinoscillum sp.]|uniref:hypothetical protein n=1 Tax=Marinoscillum sp. TaxID=2024838 RepID=UPI003BA9DFFB
MLRFLLALILFLPFIVHAQDGDYNLGASSSAMADASVATVNSWSLFNNPGASGSLKATSVMVSYQNRYNIEGFHVVGGGAIYHTRLLNFGVKYFKFGDDLFNQQLLGLVISNKLQMVSLGGGVSIIQTHAEGLKDDRKLVGEFGGLAEITDIISFGAHIFNFKHGAQYPTTMKAGMSIAPLENIALNWEVEKQLEAREIFKAGLQYGLMDFLVLRTGVNLQGTESGTTTNAAFGFGINTAGFLMDYSFTSAPLGAVHEITLSIEFGKIDE